MTESHHRDASASLFKRLKARGIGPEQYTSIKVMLTIAVPQAALFFEREFPHRRPKQVLRQVEAWKRTLKRDWVVPAAIKTDVEKRLSLAEWLAWRALVEVAFSQPVGSWRLSQRFIPTSSHARKVFIRPDIRVTAIHQQTAAKREIVIPHCKVTASWVAAWQTAFRELGVLDILLNLPASKPLVSARAPQGWPVFTQSVIPNLYEFLSPFYRRHGHIFSDKESALKRAAWFPKELLQDMLTILRVEQPATFQSMTQSQLKAVVSRYLQRRTKSSSSAKSRK